MNQSDTEVMAGILNSQGFKIVDNLEDADIIIFNSCAVKKPTQEAFFKRLKELKETKKPVIIAGCIAQTMPNKLKGYSMIGPDQIENIVEIVEETINDNVVSLLIKEDKPRPKIQSLRKNPLIEIVPISKGCLGDPCSYCIVKKARGHLYSFSIEDIKKQIKSALKEGVKEIWLTAQDTGCYGKDIGTNLPELLRQIVEIRHDFKVRVGMMNPNHVLEFMDELIEVFRNDKIFKFLHIPVQSGNDEVLKLMRRKYFASDFISIVNAFRHEMPDITIATDIICGFPTETDEQFEDSIKLIEEIKPDVLNISRFWSRPGTEAQKLKQHPGGVTKDRSSKMTITFEFIAYEKNKRWRSWVGEVFVDDLGKDDSFVARNHAYKPVILHSDYDILGKTLKVQIENTTKYDLRGKIIN